MTTYVEKVLSVNVQNCITHNSKTKHGKKSKCPSACEHRNKMLCCHFAEYLSATEQYKRMNTDTCSLLDEPQKH